VFSFQSKVLLVANRKEKETRKELETLKAEYSKGLGQIETVVSARVKCLQERLDSKEKQLLGEAKLREELQVDHEELSQRLSLMVDDERRQHDETRNHLLLEHRGKLGEVQNALDDSKSKNASLTLQIEKLDELFNEKCMHARVQEQLVKDLSDHVDELKKELNETVRSCSKCEDGVEDVKSLNREIEFLKHANAEIHLTLKEKDDTIAYISSEISGIKSVYEEKLLSDKKELEKQHSENISRVQKKLHEAARIMAKLESKLHEQQNINSALKREMCGMNESKLRAQQENQEKLNRISHLFNVLCDK
jgi:DNA repair exonuclease SbcCD ATPase subunit